MKVCTKCGEEKPLNKYARKKTRAGNPTRESQCKDCKAFHNRCKRYGLSEEDGRELLKQEDCTICGTILESTTDKFIDHCHESGRVRGLLCTHCNTGLGAFKDNVSAMERAIEYLKIT